MLDEKGKPLLTHVTQVFELGKMVKWTTASGWHCLTCDKPIPTPANTKELQDIGHMNRRGVAMGVAMDSIDIHHIGFGDQAPAHIFWQCDDADCVRMQRGKFDQGQTRALHLPCKNTNDYWFTWNRAVIGNGSKRNGGSICKSFCVHKRKCFMQACECPAWSARKIEIAKRKREHLVPL